MKSQLSTIHGIDLSKRESVTPRARTSRHHLSTILRYIAFKTGVLDEEYKKGPTLQKLITGVSPVDVGSNINLMRIVVGHAWEQWIVRQLPGVDHQPGELCWDGIYGTPDGMSLGLTGDTKSSDHVLHEIKATWKSAAYPVTDQLLWMWQVMGYLYMLSRELDTWCLTAVLHPVYLVGDYRLNRGPLYRPTIVTFEQKELEVNWQMIVDNKYNVMPEVW